MAGQDTPVGIAVNAWPLWPVLALEEAHAFEIQTSALRLILGADIHCCWKEPVTFRALSAGLHLRAFHPLHLFWPETSVSSLIPAGKLWLKLGLAV